MEAIAATDVVAQRNRAREEIALAAKCAAMTVLITAECAAAVEDLARRIHAASARAASPFVLVAAATLPSDTAVLTERCADLLDTVRGGSLLLTDIEQMPAIVQNRLLETLVGLRAEAAGQVRLIAGTTTILSERISEGAFSERLFYRLNTIHVIAKSGAGGTAPAGRVA
jgi:DNA-binding NtrC family response regulator